MIQFVEQGEHRFNVMYDGHVIAGAAEDAKGWCLVVLERYADLILPARFKDAAAVRRYVEKSLGETTVQTTEKDVVNARAAAKAAAKTRPVTAAPKPKAKTTLIGTQTQQERIVEIEAITADGGLPTHTANGARMAAPVTDAEKAKVVNNAPRTVADQEAEASSVYGDQSQAPGKQRPPRRSKTADDIAAARTDAGLPEAAVPGPTKRERRSERKAAEKKVAAEVASVGVARKATASPMSKAARAARSEAETALGRVGLYLRTPEVVAALVAKGGPGGDDLTRALNERMAFPGGQCNLYVDPKTATVILAWMSSEATGDDPLSKAFAAEVKHLAPQVQHGGYRKWQAAKAAAA